MARRVSRRPRHRRNGHHVDHRRAPDAGRRFIAAHLDVQIAVAGSRSGSNSPPCRDEEEDGEAERHKGRQFIEPPFDRTPSVRVRLAEVAPSTKNSHGETEYGKDKSPGIHQQSKRPLSAK
jgi:hypothetical protein